MEHSQINEKKERKRLQHRNKRKIELFMENHRYNDLRRSNIATYVLNNKPTRGVENLKIC